MYFGFFISKSDYLLLTVTGNKIYYRNIFRKYKYMHLKVCKEKFISYM